ncbi:hypothetical protein NS234_07440 [Microbacterium oxydans]|uniref:hypothetical protein n=1 Tax=Microbacterium oxydans TaxID=82380 RepID=UPI000734F184|nr:hypothetical protein [Microbacterium oxydans]KTR77430.1 hypothetical protein NS234_07440 [Microbacterium oxydans]
MTAITRSTDAQTVAPDLVLTEWVTENEVQTIVHRVLGRPDVDVTLRPAIDATGTMRLFFMNQAAAEAARRFHLATATFRTITTDARLPARYVPQGVIRNAQQNVNDKRWVLEIQFQELR